MKPKRAYASSNVNQVLHNCMDNKSVITQPRATGSSTSTLTTRPTFPSALK